MRQADGTLIQNRYKQCTIKSVDEALAFDWDSANIGHIARHGILPLEAEQVILNDPLDLRGETVDGEERMLSLGMTNVGRLLVVVTTMRYPKVRVVTAFPATKRMQLIYLK